MFDKNTLAEYKSITPPSELRDRIVALDSVQKKKASFNLKMISRIAACLAIVLVCGAAALNFELSQNAIYSEDTRIGAKTVSVDTSSVSYMDNIRIQLFSDEPSQRQTSGEAVLAPVCVPLEIKTARPKTISVSNGSIIMFFDDYNAYINCGNEVFIENTAKIYVATPPLDDGESITVYIDDNNDKEIINITYSNGEYLLNKEK